MNAHNASSFYLQWNSTAVELLQNGNIKEATSILSKAASGLQSYVTQSGSSLSDEDFSSLVYGAIYGESVLLANDDAVSEKNLFSFCYRALQVDENIWETAPLSAVFVILFYNLSLAMMMNAEEASVSGPYVNSGLTERHQQCLSSSLALLHSALKIMQDCWKQDFSEEGMGVILVVFNNIGYLHCHFHHTMEARSFLEAAVSLMKRPTAEDVIPPDDFSFFQESLGMFMVTGMALNTAPAA